MTSSPISAARSQYLLDLLAQIPDPRRRRGRRHPLAGLLASGIAAVIAGSRSFAAIGQWAADAGPDVLAGLVVVAVSDMGAEVERAMKQARKIEARHLTADTAAIEADAKSAQV